MKNIGEVLLKHIAVTCLTFIIVYGFTTDNDNLFEWFCNLALLGSVAATVTNVGRHIIKSKGKALILFVLVCLVVFIAGCIVLAKFGAHFVLIPMLLIESIIFAYSILNLNMNSVLTKDEQKQIDQDKIGKMKTIILQNRRLYLYEILIVLVDTGIIYGLSKIIDIKMIVFIVSIVLNIWSYYLYISKIQLKSSFKSSELLENVLSEECDAYLYCVMYRVIERNCSSIAVMYCYMRGLQCGDYVIEFDRMLKEYYMYRGMFQYKVMYYSRNAYDNNVNDSLYKEQIEYCDRIIKRIKNDKEMIYSKKILMIERKFIIQNYTEALEDLYELHDEFCEYEKTKSKLSIISLKSLESECLYHLGQYEKCMDLLEWIIENGNTLAIVRKAQICKYKIQEKLAIEV